MAARYGCNYNLESAEEYKIRKCDERDELKDKELQGQFVRQIEDIACSTSWQWLEKAYLKKETERLVMADQTVFTNECPEGKD